MIHSTTFKRIGAATALAALLATAAAHGQGETSSVDAFNIPDNITILGADPNSRKATARVNGAVITGTDVEQRVALIIAANEVQPSAEELQRLRLQVFRNLIDETLQIQEAAAREMAVTPEEVDQSYARLAAERFAGLVGAGTPEALDAYLVKIGSSPQSLKRQIQGEMAWSKLLRQYVSPFINVSEGEVEELYQRLQASRGTAEYRIGEIYLSATPETRAAVMENGRRIVQQMREGGSFVAYARQFSEASTAAVGGDLGWIRLEQLQNPQLEEVARQLTPGQLVGPVEIPGGFSILYLIDKRQVGMADPRNAIVSLKQISVEFPAGIAEADARQRISAFAAAIQQIRGCGEVEAAAPAMGAQVVSNDIAIKELPDELQQILLGLNIGQATPPFGDPKEGVRVLMMCGRDDPQVETGPDREQLMAQLEEDRVNKRAQRFLRDLRRDAVIEYN